MLYESGRVKYGSTVLILSISYRYRVLVISTLEIVKILGVTFCQLLFVVIFSCPKKSNSKVNKCYPSVSLFPISPCFFCFRKIKNRVYLACIYARYVLAVCCTQSSQRGSRDPEQPRRDCFREHSAYWRTTRDQTHPSAR